MRLPLAGLLILAASTVSASAPPAVQPIPLDSLLSSARSDAEAAARDQQRLEAAARNARNLADRIGLQRQAAAKAIEAAEARMSAADTQSQLLGSRLSQLRGELAAEQAPSQSLLGALVLMSRRSPLLVLADSRSPEQLVTVRLLLDSALPAIDRKTAALSARLRQAQALRRQQVEARTEGQEARDDLAERAAELDGLETRAAETARTRGEQALQAGDIAIASAERSSIAEREAQSRRSALAMAAELAESGPAPASPLAPAAPARPNPIDYRLPASAPVTGGFGEVSESGIRSRAITLATKRGDTIAAPASGTILFSGPFRSFGGVVIVDHGGGWRSVLVNVASALPRGSRIEGGAALGTAMGPIELQLLQGGQPVSPAIIAGSSAMLSNPAKDR